MVHVRTVSTGIVLRTLGLKDAAFEAAARIPEGVRRQARGLRNRARGWSGAVGLAAVCAVIEVHTAVDTGAPASAGIGEDRMAIASTIARRLRGDRATASRSSVGGSRVRSQTGNGRADLAAAARDAEAWASGTPGLVRRADTCVRRGARAAGLLRHASGNAVAVASVGLAVAAANWLVDGRADHALGHASSGHVGGIA